MPNANVSTAASVNPRSSQVRYRSAVFAAFAGGEISASATGNTAQAARTRAAPMNANAGSVPVYITKPKRS